MCVCVCVCVHNFHYCHLLKGMQATFTAWVILTLARINRGRGHLQQILVAPFVRCFDRNMRGVKCKRNSHHTPLPRSFSKTTVRNSSTTTVNHIQMYPPSISPFLFIWPQNSVDIFICFTLLFSCCV